MNSIKKNYIYNLLYQISIIIIPLITTPYLSRKIGVEGIGTYSYTYSIVYYFVMLTLLGVNNYGNRTIAKVRNNKKQLSNTFWSIYIMQVIMGSFMLVLYIAYILFFENKYKSIAIIQSLFIISSILDINWFFFGLEEFKITVIRNVIIKLAIMICIFIFIKSIKDVWKYTLIMSGMSVLNQIALWSFLRKRIEFERVYKEDIAKHIKNNLILFIPVITISLYKTINKILLGVISNVTEVGYYENAERIVNIPITLISVLGTVMLPRMANMFTKGEKEKIYKYISKSLEFVMFLAFAMCFGLIAIGKDFAPLYFGEQFQKTGVLITILAITIPFIAVANVIRTQYLIPNEKEKIFIISVVAGASISLITNLLLIPYYKTIGAAIGTIMAEFTVMITQIILARKEFDNKFTIKVFFKFFIKGLIMYIIVSLLKYINLTLKLRIIAQIILGTIVYFSLNYKYITSLVNENMLKRKFTNIR